MRTFGTAGAVIPFRPTVESCEQIARQFPPSEDMPVGEALADLLHALPVPDHVVACVAGCSPNTVRRARKGSVAAARTLGSSYRLRQLLTALRTLEVAR